MIHMWKKELKFAFSFPRAIKDGRIDKPDKGCGMTAAKARRMMVYVYVDADGKPRISGLGGDDDCRWHGSGFLKDSVIKKLEEAAKGELKVLCDRLDEYLVG